MGSNGTSAGSDAVAAAAHGEVKMSLLSADVQYCRS